MLLGLDLGSTTVKYVLLDDDRKILARDYRRHKSDLILTVRTLLSELNERFPGRPVRPVLSGSGALALSDALHVAFLQEVAAGATFLAERLPDVARTLLEETDNDMGHLRLFSTEAGYRVELLHDGHTHVMHVDSSFSTAETQISWQDKKAGDAVSSMLRIAYSQAVILRDAVSIHAAAVCTGGRAYLFMGKSGTGKSTHAALWIKHIPGTQLLNDDNPTVRLIDGRAYACGTPWSGKTPCYRQLSFPIGGMVRLSQAPENRFLPLEGADAFIAVYPGCSVILQDDRLCNMLYDTLATLAETVPTGALRCRPDREAALLCHDSLIK